MYFIVLSVRFDVNEIADLCHLCPKKIISKRYRSNCVHNLCISEEINHYVCHQLLGIYWLWPGCTSTTSTSTLVKSATQLPDTQNFIKHLRVFRYKNVSYFHVTLFRRCLVNDRPRKVKS